MSSFTTWPNISQLWRLQFRLTTFLNFINFDDLLTLRMFNLQKGRLGICNLLLTWSKTDRKETFFWRSHKRVRDYTDRIWGPDCVRLRSRLSRPSAMVSWTDRLSSGATSSCRRRSMFKIGSRRFVIWPRSSRSWDLTRRVSPSEINSEWSNWDLWERGT